MKVRIGSFLALTTVGALLFFAAVSAASTTCPAAGQPLTVGELFPMTGREAFVGSWFLHGAKTAIYDINANGGVMGHPLSAVLGDTAGDTVDAVPAWRQLASKNLAFELGPSSLTVESVIKLYDAQHLVTVVEGGTAQLDHMQYPYVFRTTPSDSTIAQAMAYFALHQGWTRAAIVMESTSNAQTVVKPLVAAYTSHGGTIVANVALIPHQSSYRSEVSKAYANKPQVVFFQADPQTTSTLSTDITELIGWHVPIVGTDAGAEINTAKAFGLNIASKWLYGENGAAPSGPSWTHYVKDYQAVWKTDQPVELSQNTYDGAVIAALAMTAAKSCDSTVWVNKVVSVANPPGVKVYNYADGVAALKAGKQINFQGASGPDDFNQYHNVYGSWEVVQFDAKGNPQDKFLVTAKDITGY